MIYFIQSKNTGLIKIGYTKDENTLQNRLNSLGNKFNPVELLTTHNGIMDDEFNIHDKFDHLRKQGEWFKPEKELIDFINKPYPLELKDSLLANTNFKKITLNYKLNCSKCNHEWTPRIKRKPLACPKCKSYIYDKPKDEERR